MLMAGRSRLPTRRRLRARRGLHALQRRLEPALRIDEEITADHDGLARRDAVADLHEAVATGAERVATALPLSAVRGEGAASYVWVISGDRLVRRSITIGLRDERAQLMEIVSGLQPAEVVLATKFDNLEDGLQARILGGADSKTAGPPVPKPPVPPS